MYISTDSLPALGARLAAERKRLGLSRAQVAAQCGLSVSFVRDAESNPERCTLARLLRLSALLGLELYAYGWQTPDAPGAPGTLTDVM